MSGARELLGGPPAPLRARCGGCPAGGHLGVPPAGSWPALGRGLCGIELPGKRALARCPALPRARLSADGRLGTRAPATRELGCGMVSPQRAVRAQPGLWVASPKPPTRRPQTRSAGEQQAQIPPALERAWVPLRSLPSGRDCLLPPARDERSPPPSGRLRLFLRGSGLIPACRALGLPGAISERGLSRSRHGARLPGRAGPGVPASRLPPAGPKSCARPAPPSPWARQGARGSGFLRSLRPNPSVPVSLGPPGPHITDWGRRRNCVRGFWGKG